MFADSLPWASQAAVVSQCRPIVVAKGPACGTSPRLARRQGQAGGPALDALQPRLDLVEVPAPPPSA